jgi:GGDEF domain-containing protein
MRWNVDLGMLSRAGLDDAIDRLPPALYTVVFCDIDRLKAINSATRSHFQTNRYLRVGLEVRSGEIAGQLLGDEIVFILAAGADVAAFVRRIRRQLRAQPLTQEERRRLIIAGGDGRLSATFAYRERVSAIWPAIEACSVDVLTQKEQRP